MSESSKFMVFHGWIAPELAHLEGLARDNLISRRATRVVSIRFPFAYRVGEAATYVIIPDDLNVAATARSNTVVTKVLVTVFAGRFAEPTGGVEDAVRFFAGMFHGCSEAERVVRACFAPCDLGEQVAFERAVTFNPPDHDQVKETKMDEKKINVVQFVVHNTAGQVLDHGIEAVGPGVSDLQYRVRKAVAHGVEACVWYQVLFRIEPAVADPLAALRAALA